MAHKPFTDSSLPFGFDGTKQNPERVGPAKEQRHPPAGSLVRQFLSKESITKQIAMLNGKAGETASGTSNRLNVNSEVKLSHPTPGDDERRTVSSPPLATVQRDNPALTVGGQLNSHGSYVNENIRLTISDPLDYGANSGSGPKPLGLATVGGAVGGVHRPEEGPTLPAPRLSRYPFLMRVKNNNLQSEEETNRLSSHNGATHGSSAGVLPITSGCKEGVGVDPPLEAGSSTPASVLASRLPAGAKQPQHGSSESQQVSHRTGFLSFKTVPPTSDTTVSFPRQINRPQPNSSQGTIPHQQPAVSKLAHPASGPPAANATIRTGTFSRTHLGGTGSPKLGGAMPSTFTPGPVALNVRGGAQRISLQNCNMNTTLQFGSAQAALGRERSETTALAVGTVPKEGAQQGNSGETLQKGKPKGNALEFINPQFLATLRNYTRQVSHDRNNAETLRNAHDNSDDSSRPFTLTNSTMKMCTSVNKSSPLLRECRPARGGAHLDTADEQLRGAKESPAYPLSPAHSPLERPLPSYTAATSTSISASTAPAYDFRVVLSSGKTSTQPISLSVGSGSVQGMRHTMEDEHFAELNKTTVHQQAVSLLAVLDGHCGRRVAKLASNLLPEFFFSHSALGDNNALAMVESILLTDRAIYKALSAPQKRETVQGWIADPHFNAFGGESLRDDHAKAGQALLPEEEDDDNLSGGGMGSGGSTLIAAAVHGRMLYVACLGDARAVLYDGRTTIAMSEDHKPNNAKENKRIVRCGGFVQFGRVCGVLAVSRALGDFEFKISGDFPGVGERSGGNRNDFSGSLTSFSSPPGREPSDVGKCSNKTPSAHREYMVSNIADVRQINLTDSSIFLILACDGLWDVLTNEEATQFVKDFLIYTPDINDPLVLSGLKPRPSEKAISRVLDNCCQKLVEFAVDRGSMDNVSAMVLFFHNVIESVANFAGAHTPAVPEAPVRLQPRPPLSTPPTFAVQLTRTPTDSSGTRQRKSKSILSEAPRPFLRQQLTPRQNQPTSPQNFPEGACPFQSNNFLTRAERTKDESTKMGVKSPHGRGLAQGKPEEGGTTGVQTPFLTPTKPSANFMLSLNNRSRALW